MGNSRRDFLKKSLATAAIVPAFGASNTLFSNTLDKSNWEGIPNDQLLADFDIWVESYVQEIKKEKKLGREFKDNKALVDLPSQMETLMPRFKERFIDADFLKEYVRISSKLTQEIDMNF